MQFMDDGSEPRFFKALLPDFSTQLQLPRAFVQKHIFMEDYKSGNATLLGPDRKTWNVSLHKNQQDTYFSGDEWRACTEALDLNVGYFLLFSYMGNMQFLFEVFDRSACEKDYPLPSANPQPQPQPRSTSVSTKNVAAVAAAKRARKCTTVKRTRQCKAGHLFQIVSQHGNDNSFSDGNGGSITSICKVCRCTRLETWVSRANLSSGKHHMRLPVPFCKLSGISMKHGRLNLVDLRRQSWPISFKHPVNKSAKFGYETFMSSGWKQFSIDNQLEIGDCCIFELESGVKDTMLVQVLRS